MHLFEAKQLSCLSVIIALQFVAGAAVSVLTSTCLLDGAGIRRYCSDVQVNSLHKCFCV